MCARATRGDETEKFGRFGVRGGALPADDTRKPGGYRVLQNLELHDLVCLARSELGV